MPAYEDSAATATANWQIAAAQAGHDNAIALAQADDDYAHGLDWNDYVAEQATADALYGSQTTTADNGFSEALGAADAAQTTTDAGVTLTNAEQIADAVFGDSIADDKAIDLYSHAESDAYDGQQKNDAQALWSQQTTDAIAYFNSLNNIDQTTPWGAQAAAQAQAQMTLAVTLAQAALTLTDATADAQDGQEDTEWDLQQSQSDTLAQLAHDQAYSDAQATYNASLAQAAATAALAAADGYFATLPLPPGDGWGAGGFVVDESWIQGGLLNDAPAPFTDSYDYLNNVDDISADGTLGWSWSVGPTTQPFMSIGNVAGSGATTWALAIQAPYDPPNPYAGTVGWPGTATVGSVPAGQWDENPPPVPDVGATIYAAEQQTSAKPSDAPTARQPGDVPGDGTNPAAQSPLSASRKSMDGMLSPPRDFGTRGRHPSGAELMGLTPGTSTQQVEESYQRLGGPRPNDPPGTQSNPSSPTWWAAIVGGADAALSGTVNVVGGILSTLAEVPAAIIDVGGIATEATARATFNTNWTYSPLSSSGQDEGGSFSEKAKNRAWEYAQQVATLGTKEFDEAYQEYLETGDPTRMQNSAGNLAGNAIGAKVGGRIIGKVRELASRGTGVAAPESSGPAPDANAGPETPTRTAPILEAMADAQAIEAFEGEGGAPEAAPLERQFPTKPGGTGATYDELNGQGVYILRDVDGNIRYVGRGDVHQRFKAHAEPGSGKEDLVGEILFDNNLPAEEAISLENELMQALGGPESVNANTALRNKIQGVAESNADFIELEFAAGDELLIEALIRAGLLPR